MKKGEHLIVLLFILACARIILRFQPVLLRLQQLLLLVLQQLQQQPFQLSYELRLLPLSCLLLFQPTSELPLQPLQIQHPCY